MMIAVLTIGLIALAVVAAINLLSEDAERRLVPIKISSEQPPARRQQR